MGTIVSEEELKDNAFAFLKSRNLMVLGTSAHNKVWSATVYYVVTDEFEFIFYSRPDTRHAENIETNEHVSIVVTEIPVKDHKGKSIQLSGIARRADGAEWNHYYPLYEAQIKQAATYSDHIIYVVKPTEIYMIDQKLLGTHNRIRIL